MQGSPVGNNIGKYLKLSFVRTGGTESRRIFKPVSHLEGDALNVALLVPAVQTSVGEGLPESGRRSVSVRHTIRDTG